MPEFQRANAQIYYEESGSGEPVLATHGLTENTAYWSIPGITSLLAERYRVISMDMRGHGRTRVDGEPTGYDPDSMGDDLEALADHLGIDRFHLLSHSTGGMVSVRYAMRGGQRLASLMLTDAGSATAVTPGDPATRRAALAAFASGFAGRSWDEILQGSRANPGFFFGQLDKLPGREKMWEMVDRMWRLGDPDTLAAFIPSFYTDPDPQLEGLRGIRTPTLVLLGEHDVMFLEASRLMAKEIPDCEHVVLEGLGHMTAIEDPERTGSALLEFMARNPL